MRHFNGLQSLLITLGQAYKELFLLMGLLFVCVLTFASLIYFAERDSTSKWSFIESFWWGLMVLTTVGIGDKSPHSITGQVDSRIDKLLLELSWFSPSTPTTTTTQPPTDPHQVSFNFQPH